MLESTAANVEAAQGPGEAGQVVSMTPLAAAGDSHRPLPAEGSPGDRNIAAGILKAVHGLQEALDAAALAGLIVGPNFKRFPDRFKDRGSNADSFVVSVEVYRRLT